MQEVDDEVQYVLDNDEVYFYDRYKRQYFTNVGLKNFIRLYRFIPAQFRVITGGEEMATASKKTAGTTKKATAKKAVVAKKPASKTVTKSKSK